jgi:hypothetical protein
MYSVSGRVFEIESGRPIPALYIQAFDKDPRSADSLGQTVTDDNGQFQMSYSDAHFGTGEKAPDLYVEVRAFPEQELLYTSLPQLRKDASRKEHYEIGISCHVLGSLSPLRRLQYGPQQQRAEVALLDEHGARLNGERVLVVTQHSLERKQWTVSARGDEPLGIELPIGRYSVQATMQGRAVANGLAVLKDGSPTFLSFALPKVPERKIPKIEDRLSTYGLAAHAKSLRSISLKKGETLEMSGQAETSTLVRLKPKSIRDVREWLGVGHEFGHDEPIFGDLMPIHPELNRSRGNTQEAQVLPLSDAARNQLVAISHEFLYGNMSAVAQFEDLLNQHYRASGIHEILVRLVRDVDIADGARLVVNSNVFFAATLRMYGTGTLQLTRSCKLDIDRVEQH